MPPKTPTPLPQLIKRRVELVRDQVRGRQWSSITPLPAEMGPRNRTFISCRKAARQSFRPVTPGTYFEKRPPAGDPSPFYWRQRWFRLKLPAAKRGEKGKRHLYWKANGETTVYIDGRPWCGLDGCHPTCFVPDTACTLLLCCGTWQTGIWSPREFALDDIGLQFVEAGLRVRDEPAWHTSLDLDIFCHWLDAIYGEEDVPAHGVSTLEKPLISKCKPVLRRMLKQLDDAMDAYDRGGLQALAPALRNVYRQFKAEAHNLKVSYVGHAHLDLVWLWPERVTYQKAIHTFATMNNLMRRYPDFVFTMSQPPLLNHVKQHEPAQYQEVLKHIRGGQWEATGGLEVESDTHMAVGEGLARALIYGQERIAEFRGKPATTVWIPDVFGYSQCLPQVFSLGGIKYFYTQKMTWSSVSRFPHNSFVWKGADGSTIITHLANSGYNSEVTIGEALHAESEYRQSDVHDEVLIGAGYGDGGGGVCEEHIERARRLADLARVPRVSFTRVEDFFDRLARVRDDLPVYRGELYMEYHRGTYTTQGEFKHHFRACERALQAREAVRVLQGKAPLPREDWLRYIFAQFHDAIPGSSIRDVYAEFVPELKALSESHHAAARKEWKTRGKNATTIINPTMLPRMELVELAPPTAAAKDLVDDTGTRLPYQFSGTGRSRTALAFVALDGLESRSLSYRKGGTVAVEEDIAVRATSTRLENGIAAAGFDRDGQLTSLAVDGHDLQIAGRAGFALHIDNPADFNAWDIDHSANWLGEPAAEQMQLRIVEKGPLRAVLRGKASMGEASALSVDYILEANRPCLKVEVTVDWREKHRLLRYTVPTNFKGTHARFGSAFGSVDRTQQEAGQAEEAQWEVPGSRWMAALNGAGEGLAIVTEAKYGFRCKDGAASLSLLRSPSDPDPLADRGIHRIRFALMSHEHFTDGFDHSTAAAAETLYTPFLVVPGAGVRDVPFTLDGLDGVVPSWILPSRETDGAYIIRMHETTCSDALVTIAFREPPGKIYRVDFLENRIGSVRKRSARRFEIPVKQTQIVSLKVEPG